MIEVQVGLARRRDDARRGWPFERSVGGLPSVVVAGTGGKPGNVSGSTTHGGFDNDPDTLNSILRRVLGAEPQRLFTARDLQNRMLEDAGVATVAGTSFGIMGEGYIRFSYANSTDNIREAIARVGTLLARG